VRLRIRTLVSLAVAVAPLLASVSCCKSHLIGDVVPGAPKGSALVKIRVILSDKEGKCSAELEPPTRVVVYRGGAIRWRVVDNCKSAHPNHLTFTKPQPPKDAKEGKYGKPTAWDFKFCTPTIANLLSGENEKNVLICEVPDNVAPAVYKYNLEGAAQLDPDIEVRKGG
jgi:hypothetical protein